MNESLQQSAADVERRISDACARSGRNRSEVNIVAVTKYVSLERTQETVEAGYAHLGENRWPDAKQKWEAFSLNDAVTWHFIGHLQTNKVKDVARRFHMIHSLDRWSLAKELQKTASRLGIVIPCFVQVNISGEESKYGLDPDSVFEFITQLRDLSAIDVIGLMTMAPFEAEAEQTRPVFRKARMLRDEINRKGLYTKPLPHLSMGMSNDFEIAVEEGATWVRLGSVLVGKQ